MMIKKKSSSGELATVKIEFQKLWFWVPQRRTKSAETGFKNTNFFRVILAKMETVTKWIPVSLLPLPNVVYDNTGITVCSLVFTAKQLWIGGGKEAYFVCLEEMLLYRQS